MMRNRQATLQRGTKIFDSESAWRRHHSPNWPQLPQAYRESNGRISVDVNDDSCYGQLCGGRQDVEPSGSVINGTGLSISGNIIPDLPLRLFINLHFHPIIPRQKSTISPRGATHAPRRIASETKFLYKSE